MSTLDLGTNLRDLFRNHKKQQTLPKFYSSSGSLVDTIDKCSYIELLDSLIYPRSVLTPFKSKRGSSDNYPLNVVVNCLLNSSLSYTDYMHECRKSSCPAVSLVDRKDLIAYLHGEKSNCDCMDPTFVPPVPYRSVEEAVRKAKSHHKQPEEMAVNATSSTKVSGEVSVSKMLQKIERRFTFRPGISKKNYSFVLGVVKEALKKHSAPASVTASLRTGTRNSMLDSIKANAELLSSKEISAVSTASSQLAFTGIPIIIVPSSFSSLINMHNVKGLLESEAFVTPQEARAKGPVRKEIKIKVSRPGTNQQFYVIDNVNRLKVEDWSSVVAVFVQGEAWQFKGWKWESPVELFSNVKGYWLKYEDEDRPCEARNWNVEILNISKSKRHLDSAAAIQFWNSLESFLEKRKKKM